MKDHIYNYLNCGERYEFMVDHRSYTHNLSSCEIKFYHNFQSHYFLGGLTFATLITIIRVLKIVHNYF